MAPTDMDRRSQIARAFTQGRRGLSNSLSSSLFVAVKRDTKNFWRETAFSLDCVAKADYQMCEIHVTLEWFAVAQSVGDGELVGIFDLVAKAYAARDDRYGDTQWLEFPRQIVRRSLALDGGSDG